MMEGAINLKMCTSMDVLVNEILNAPLYVRCMHTYVEQKTTLQRRTTCLTGRFVYSTNVHKRHLANVSKRHLANVSCRANKARLSHGVNKTSASKQNNLCLFIPAVRQQMFTSIDEK